MPVYFIVSLATKQTFLMLTENKKGCSTFLFFTGCYQEDGGKFYFFILQGVNETKKVWNPWSRR